MQRLRRIVRRVHEVRVRRAQITGELIQRVIADENAGRHVQDTVIGVEFLDRRAAAGGVPLAEDLLKVALKEFVDTVTHDISLWLLTGAEPGRVVIGQSDLGLFAVDEEFGPAMKLASEEARKTAAPAMSSGLP